MSLTKTNEGLPQQQELPDEDIGTSDFESYRSAIQQSGAMDDLDDLNAADYDFGITDDTTLLRFFRARKGNVQQALSQFLEAHKIRRLNRIHEFYDAIDVRAYEETKALYPSWTGRLCKKGQPIFVFDASALGAETMKSYMESCAGLKVPFKADVSARDKLSVPMIRSFAVFDHLTRFVIPLCNNTGREKIKDEDLGVSKMILVVDMAGMSWTQVWNLRDYLQDFTKILSTSFPEILDKVFITGTSWGFPAIWNMVKRLADPETTNKFSILRQDDVLSTLKTHIDVENIPIKYGGHLDHHHGMAPILDDRLADTLIWKAGEDQILPEGPLKWTGNTHDDSHMDAVATGSLEGKPRLVCFASGRSRSQESQ